MEGPPPLQVSIGYSHIQFDVNRPLAHATGGLVPLTVKYGGVASVQVPGSLSYPLWAHSGSFEQTKYKLDIRIEKVASASPAVQAAPARATRRAAGP